MEAKFYEDADHSRNYKNYRRPPPKCVGEKLATYIKEKIASPYDLAVDIGCGTGQGTEIIAPYFKQVIGFDSSVPQINEANATNKFPNISYKIASAESLPVADASCTAVTVFTAFHYFDQDKFYAEATRVLVPNGVIAICIYIPEKILHEGFGGHILELLQKYIPKDLLWFEKVYENLQFPAHFEDIIRKEETFDFEFTFDDLWKVLHSMNCFNNLLHTNPEKVAELKKDLEDRTKKSTGTDNIQEAKVTVQYRLRYFFARKQQ